MTVVLRPSAVEDLREASTYYVQVGDDVADAFEADFDLVIERLEVFPQSGRPVENVPGVRRARMRRFPYGVFYWLPSPDEVRVLGFCTAHVRTRRCS